MSQQKSIVAHPVKFLEVFYAVTFSSVLKVVIFGEKSVPWMEKIALRRENQFNIGHKICDGTMISISRELTMFLPVGRNHISLKPTVEREILYVSPAHWGAREEGIVALFLNKRAALKCFRYANSKPCDSNWRAETMEVLRAIGTKHPYCSISMTSSTFWLISPSEWQRKPK